MAVAQTINITVDKDFARFGSKSYAINKINTVEVRERQPHGIGGAIFCGIIALLLFYGGVSSALNDTGDGGGTAIVGAIIFAGIAYWSWKRSQIREYQLFLMTSSSSTQAYISNDEFEVMNLRDSIESAMVGKLDA
ncbi:DUF6232 family protein [Sphingomonas sp. Leaf30]|uniref:DUF6232 family protein n=1 Tax=Sphingomonas sp. Leaf30 TaxID=1736213 RepID=UPI0006F27405|nr:DUF6232 family protein [Sphingomonas sp. Leaf30]KQN14274.1 hypothetical protein ASE89_11195 [Sphingomonas sp. Leaf30]